MTALYTDIDPFVCAVAAARLADGRLPTGDVACADVRGLGRAELDGYSHVHLFCGIGGSPLGLSLAGWPPEWSVVTGGPSLSARAGGGLFPVG